MFARPPSTDRSGPFNKRRTNLYAALLLAWASIPVAAADIAPDQADADSLLSWRTVQSADLVVFDRADLDASGDLSVADFLRDLPMASGGNYRPRSGNSAQPLADINLFAFGSKRTLVLLDGRPLPKSPLDPATVNLNMLPLGMIESIELMGFGGSSRFGADAGAGVVNLRTRKQFAGMHVGYAFGRPEVRGGDTEAGTLLMGADGERGWVSAGVSFNRRDLVFTRDDLGGTVLGSTAFGNNYQLANASSSAPQGPIQAMPGFACNGSGRGLGGPADLFYRAAGSAVCQFNFNAISARDASASTAGLFVRGEYTINDSWLGYLNSSVRREQSFGRFAPTPATLFVPEGSPNDPVPGDGRGAFLLHRFAAVGPRDNEVDETDRDLVLGVRGQWRDGLRLGFGIADSDNQAFELGRNYIVTRLAEAAIQDGRYDVRNPFAADEAVLASISATINRDAHWHRQEVFADLEAALFATSAGVSTLDLRASWLRDDFADIYDSLQFAGEIQGSAGNSAAGQRIQRSLAAHLDVPLHEDWSLALSARGDQFSDLASAFSPGIHLSWQPWTVFGVEAGVERGFVAPNFDQRYGETSVQLRSLVDVRTCVAAGRFDCASNPSVQVPTRLTSNPTLESESTQHAFFGLRYQPVSWLDLRAVYRDLKVDDPIRQVGFQDLVLRDTLGLPLPPGVTVGRDPITGAINLLEAVFDNQGSEHHRHLDLQASGQFDWGRLGQFESSLLASHVAAMTLTSVGFDDTTVRSDASASVPAWRARWQQRWLIGDFEVRATTHWIDAYGDDTGLLRVGDYQSHDLHVSWQAPWQARISVGATNIGNRMPSRDSAIGTDPYNFYLYDSYGRTVTVSYQQSF